MTRDNRFGTAQTTFTEEQALNLLRHWVQQAGSQKGWLHKNKSVSIKQCYLSDILKGKRHLSNNKVLKAIGLKRMVVYVEDNEAST